jgi:asparagine synthetase B (glutamine-hydrolysing)
MCGIFASESFMDVLSNLNSMQHRGPDARGWEKSNDFMVGAVRLALVDKASGAASQPHRTRRGNIVAFNGEIYNYRQLWRTAQSEIELIGELIDDGLDPRQFFDGDYAILHFNPSTATVTLYRDRFGVCPLYYELRPLVRVSSEARRLVRPREVPAHGRVVIDLKRRSIRRRDIFPIYGATSEDSAQDLAPLIERAVWSRSMHGGPVSLALSGGIDSAVIAYAMRNVGLAPKMSLSFGFRPDSEDLSAAKRITDDLRWESTHIIATPNEEQAARIREHFDSPHVTPLRWRGGLRMWYVAEESPTRVILCGDGPDELLGGYVSHASTIASGKEYITIAKRLSTLRSMQHFNLDRTNKMGMAHSKEFRAPFLASALSQVLLGLEFQHGKGQLRDLLRYWGAPEQVWRREHKYSSDELAIKEVPV